MSNALSYYDVPLTYDAVVNYSIYYGIINEAANMIAEHFTKAQQHKYAVRDHDYDFMKQMMEREDWD